MTLLIGAFLLFSLQAYYAMRASRFTLVDDAYISLRYAWQWINGAGVVWQSGDRVEGYTNFLQVALLAVGMYTGADGEMVAYIIGVGVRDAAVSAALPDGAVFPGLHPSGS
jgi:hypothetical protein